MAEKNTSSFKVFLTKEGINDVRRFNLEHHTHLSIKRFKEELHNVFPILDAHDYTLAWKGKQNCNYFYVQRTGILN